MVQHESSGAVSGNRSPPVPNMPLPQAAVTIPAELCPPRALSVMLGSHTMASLAVCPGLVFLLAEEFPSPRKATPELGKPVRG